MTNKTTRAARDFIFATARCACGREQDVCAAIGTSPESRIAVLCECTGETEFTAAVVVSVDSEVAA